MLTLRLSLYTLASAFAKSFKKLFSTWHLGLELRECRRHEFKECSSPYCEFIYI